MSRLRGCGLLILVSACAVAAAACGDGDAGNRGEVTSVSTAAAESSCSNPSFLTETDCADAGHDWGGPAVSEVSTEASCGSAKCGVAANGALCGTCEASQMCWSGQCIDDDGIGCDDTSFLLDGDSAITPFSAGSHRLVYTATGPDYQITADDGRPLATKKITIEVSHEKLFGDGPVEPGTYELGTDDAKEDCALCVRGGTQCNKQGCATNFVVESGTLEISQTGTPGTTFAGHMSKVIFREIDENDVDPTTKEFGGKQFGQTWCLGDYSFEIAVPEQTQTEDNCIEEGTGRLIGDNIADYTLIHCKTGDIVNLHSYCGTEKKALWLIAASGW